MVPSPETQLDWLASALQDLEGFLVAPEVFRPTFGGQHRDLSLGNVLLAVDVVTAGESLLPPERRGEASRAVRRWETIRSRRPVAIEDKALAELSPRLHAWGAYLQDLGATPAEAVRYPVEVRQRVILSRLLGLLAAREAAQPGRGRVQAADAALRRRFEPGPFVWEAILQEVYPPTDFWFLYGRPAGPG